ncbi:MAG TPA: deoxyribonuclease IV, partial [Acidimicrobiales bacterium]|nr:deoxyribonuclease IV [Acidimicrobiales bacterium]
MLIGAHVRAGGKLVPALERASEIGAEVVQVFTQSPRAWKPTQYAPDVLAGYRAAQATHPDVSATFCHATYLINLATDDRDLLARSRACLIANLEAARGMGADGLVLHIGSHKGLGAAGCVPQVADVLVEATESAVDPLTGELDGCPILLENAAGAGGTMGRSFDELADVLDRAGDTDLGVCLDTQHLWASGIGFATVDEADRAIAAFDDVIGLDRLRFLHLNDSKVPFGANRDRHENLGAGTIGLDGLGALISHPALRDLAAALEVPGSGDGPD